jgi:hypothetical protein
MSTLPRRESATQQAPDYWRNVTHLGNPWPEYERRKAIVRAMNLTPAQYEAAIKAIVDEMGI